MELKKHLNWRYVFVSLYVILFAVYLIVGLQPAQASDYEVLGELMIPGIGLESEVVKVDMRERKLETPDTVVGSYASAENKTLLVGHSTTVFTDLDKVKLGNEMLYNGVTYKVKKIETSIRERVHMNELLKREDEDTLVIMTCAGELLGNGEATHRLIVTAIKN